MRQSLVDLQDSGRSLFLDWLRLLWLEESHALFRRWEVGRSWRWRAWLELWPSDPEKGRERRKRGFNVGREQAREPPPEDYIITPPKHSIVQILPRVIIPSLHLVVPAESAE